MEKVDLRHSPDKLLKKFVSLEFMRRFFKAAVLTAFLLLMGACTPVNDRISLLGGSIENVHVGNPVKATLSLNIVNRRGKVDIRDISGKVNMGEKPIAYLCAESVVIPARDTSNVKVGIQASLAEGVGTLSVVRMLAGGGIEDCTLDLDFTVRDFLGIKHRKKMHEVPLAKLIGNK